MIRKNLLYWAISAILLLCSFKNKPMNRCTMFYPFLTGWEYLGLLRSGPVRYAREAIMIQWRDSGIANGNLPIKAGA